MVTKAKSGKYDTEDPAISAETEESASSQQDHLESDEEKDLEVNIKMPPHVKVKINVYVVTVYPCITI